jgi:hypothetical protein
MLVMHLEQTRQLLDKGLESGGIFGSQKRPLDLSVARCEYLLHQNIARDLVNMSDDDFTDEFSSLSVGSSDRTILVAVDFVGIGCSIMVINN